VQSSSNEGLIDMEPQGDARRDDPINDVASRHVEQVEPPPLGVLELSEYLRVRHIISELAAHTKADVIAELAFKTYQLGLVRDQAWFTAALLERERVMTSAIGHGIAFLHTVHRQPEQLVRPFIVLGRSSDGVNFDSLDGLPSHLFFVLGLKQIDLHLRWLQKLSQILIVPERLRALLAAQGALAIHQILRDGERTVTAKPFPNAPSVPLGLSDGAPGKVASCKV
jgi:nitrogen PTS system EIIA component